MILESTATPDGSFVIRQASLVAVLVGAAGSVALTVYAGRHHMHTPAALLFLFAAWVLSPFIVLAVASVISKQWSLPTRTALHALMLLLSLASLAIYGYVGAVLPAPKTAVFVLVPPASWLLVALVLLTTAGLSRHQARR